MKKLKVMTVVGTRPELIRLSRVISKLDQCADHILVHTGQNYDFELNRIFFEELGIRAPDYYLNAVGESSAKTIGNIIARVDEVLVERQPDAMLVLGDTNSCLAVIAGKKRKVPIFHMEAGNRCFDQRVPEENNRKLVDHLSDINLPYSSISREYLLREGVPADRIIKTGSPMREVLQYYMHGILASDVLDRFSLSARQYFVVSCHREENVDAPDRLSMLASLLNAVAEEYKLPIIMSMHPRTRMRLEEFSISLDDRVRAISPLGLFDYVQLQRCSRAVLSDSGTITEESNILGFPALNIRDAHERPEGMEEGAVLLTGLSVDRVLQGLAMLGTIKCDEPVSHAVFDYSADNVSDKVVRIIYSYTDFINRNVWRKDL